MNLELRLSIFLVLLAGCDANLPGKPNPEDRPIPPDRVLTFDALFSRQCAGCHGADGKLGPAPPLNDPLFRAIVPASALEKVLQEGRAETPMTAFAHKNGGTLTEAQIQVLIHEIKGTRYRIDDESGPKWGPVEPAPAAVPPYLMPEKPGNAERGATLFVQACADCHGDNGSGVTIDGKLRNKINDQAFLALISDQAIRRIIITGRPDLGMPTYAQKRGRSRGFQPLTSEEIADLGALLASWRKGKS